MISKDEVKHIATLARIGVSDEEVEKFSKDLSTVLDWIEQLKEVDVSGVQPAAHIVGIKNIARDDIAREFPAKGDLVKLFPEEKSGYDKVKSVL